MQELNPSNQQKVIEFLHSGDPANDLLAFEMIKYVELNKTLMIALIYIQKVTNVKQIKRDLSNFFSKDTNHRLNLNPELESIKSELESERFFYPSYTNLRKYFSHNETLDFLFFLAMRYRHLGFAERFLIHDNGEHPKRNLIVDILMTSQKQKSFSDFVLLSGLSFNELERADEKLLKDKYGKQRINYRFTDLKADKLSTNFQKLRFNQVEIKSFNQNYISIFPEFLFSFPFTHTLRLPIDTVNVFPKVGENQVNIKQLELTCSDNVEFTNFDFLNLFSGLKTIIIKGGYVCHPNTFLGLGKISIQSSAEFKSTEGYKINAPLKGISNIASYLNKMPLSINERLYFFSKLLRLRNLGNMSFFSDEELKRLEEFIPSRHGEQRIMDWGTLREIKFRKLGPEIDFYIQQIS